MFLFGVGHRNQKGKELQKFSYKKQLRPELNIALLEVTPFPDWQAFPEFVEEFIAAENAEVVVQDYGMDRYQIRYRKKGKQYILQFEHYTDSIWIEPDC